MFNVCLHVFVWSAANSEMSNRFAEFVHYTVSIYLSKLLKLYAVKVSLGYWRKVLTHFWRSFHVFLCSKYIAILVGLFCPSPHLIWYRSLTVRKFARILKFSNLHIKVGKKLGIYMGINVWVVGKLFRVRSVFKSCGSFVPPPPC